MSSEIDPLIEPVTVFVSNSLSEASLVQSLLEGSGIQAFLFDDNLSKVDPPAAIVIGGIKIAVPRQQQEMALELLKDFRTETAERLAPSFESAESLPDEEYRCPHCNARLEAETIVCPKCGTKPFEDGAGGPATP